MGEKTLTEKLLIKPNIKISFINPPDYFFDELETDENTTIDYKVYYDTDLIVLFVNNREELVKFISEIIKKLKYDAVLWICYPKRSSGIKTDISRNQGWEVIYNYGYKPVTQISIDEIWSGIRFRKIELIGKPRKQ